MKIVGIIAEYNPFHLGHEHQISVARERSGCDHVIVCIAGSFTQRGEPACLSPARRAEMALRCGADAVFELPALFACRTADAFAAGGVSILGGLGADFLSFGCEADCIPYLEPLSLLSERENESAQLSALVQSKLACGSSHARARGEAVSELLGLPPGLIDQPNAILGAQYLRAIRRHAPELRPLPVVRNSGYHSDRLYPDRLPSASAIRSAIRSGNLEAASHFVPDPVRDILLTAPRMHAPDDIALWTLRRMTPEQLRRLPDVNEGLENRVLRCAAECGTIEALLTKLKCRRYTHARLSRLIAHAMLGITAELCAAHPLPEYARLIGMRTTAAPLLKELKRRSRLPIIPDPVRLKGDPVFEIDLRAAELRTLCEDDPAPRRANTVFTERFVRV